MPALRRRGILRRGAPCAQRADYEHYRKAWTPFFQRRITAARKSCSNIGSRKHARSAMSAASCRFCPRSWDCRAASESTNGEWDAVHRGTELCRSLGLAESVSGATVLLNAATTMKAFGEAEASIPYYEDVRGVYEKYLDPDDARFGGLYNNMALALRTADGTAKQRTHTKRRLSLCPRRRTARSSRRSPL